MATFDLGDAVPLTWVLGSTGTVVLTITLPDGSTSLPAVSGSSTYTATYTPTLAGRHVARWVSTGATTAAQVDVFDVWANDPRLIISLADAKDALNITGTTHDDELRLFIAACTDVIESIAGPVLSRTLVETYDGGVASIILRNAPVTSATTVVEAGTTLAATDYALDPVAGTLTRMIGIYPWVFRFGQQNVVVTYKVGATTVPAYVVMAARELVRHWYQFGQQGQRPSFGGSFESDGVVVAGYAVPNRVVQLLQPSGGIPGIA